MVSPSSNATDRGRHDRGQVARVALANAPGPRAIVEPRPAGDARRR
jgi:hypothetical protein